MRSFASAFSAYRATDGHTARISKGKDGPSLHARRRALLREGKIAQAAAIRKAHKLQGKP
ncbi:hypothetical protein DWB85_16195 [Seongchinamella sediminis]|uniref:Uncharacterized protein n=1 Tax=Seongchinamella sediminis TaxID=2283635 RepID=A0A3L7DVQ1_9GAMM|nr:hypothetical protein [Seongchinamella sediminis]RLQ20670.1 hypothetical protein DWB85_16195 [Seongchinamella sediminis]